MLRMRSIVLVLSASLSLLAGCSCETSLGSVDGGLDGSVDVSVDGAADASLDAPPSDGGPRCTESTVQSWALDNYDDVSVRYRARIRPDVGTRPFDLYLEFNRYADTTYVGTFPLGEDHDANFGGCAHCVVAFYGTSFDPAYFALSGSLTLNRDPFDLTLDAVLTDVRLVEVTIEGDDLHSVPVPGGGCLHFDRIEVNRSFPPPGWTCGPDEYGDGLECDCRCGVPDSDCFDPALPVIGCTAGQLCVPRFEGFEVNSVCVDDCDRGSGAMCPGTQVCVDDPVGDLCESDATLVDRGAAVGDLCTTGARYCGIEGAAGGPGVATAYCDIYDRNDGRCSRRCSVDADCNTGIFERCYTIGSSPGPTGEEAFYGFCSLRYPAGWTCRGDAYEDGVTCDCACGVADPDCSDPTHPVVGCAADQACVLDDRCTPGDDTCRPGSLCIAIPVNDTCAGALPLSVGMTNGSTRGATNDYTHVRDGGGCIGVEEDAPDVVYAVDLSVGQRLTVTGVAASFNIALYLSGPGAPSVCDRTSSGCVAGVEATGFGEAETLTFTATSPGTYYLVVDGFFSGFMGDFVLTTVLE